MTNRSVPTSVRASFEELRSAALDRSPIQGLTHCFYRYPARFSPTFAGAAIEGFSRPGQIVLDPYMGGGTAVIESIVRGRLAIGNDLNSLAVFVTRVKTACLDDMEREALLRWADNIVPSLSYRSEVAAPERVFCSRRTRNLSLPIARSIKKIIALALEALPELPSIRSRDFARCALLNVGQLALNGRKRATPLWEFRELLQDVFREMLTGLEALQERVSDFPSAARAP
ncbi:MAG: hypothetical protein IID33_14495, partial [Planctomycetes bacterium]|nr:hypothetical protein [Planctomycetota bacterium]